MPRRTCRLLLPVLPVLIAPLAGMLGLIASGAAADGFEDDIHPLVSRYCADCHSTADKAGEIDLERFASAADVVADPAPWQLVADQLRSGAMPPAGAPQPTPEERAALRAGLRRALLAIAARTAGDPGPVVLRRLSNAEYTASVRDLTGVSTLDPGKEFPVDGAAGEGFTNVGQALVMSPEMVDKYLDAAKEIAAHAVLTPDGVRFSPSTTKRDWTEEALAGIRDIYARNTVNTGATSVNLQGIAFDTNAGGRPPLVACLAAALAERDGLLAGTISPAEAAAKHGVSPKYLAALVAALVDPAPSLPLEAVRKGWREAGPGDAEALARLIEPWQSALWTFNTIGHIGKRDGPKAWQTPVTPLAERREIRLKLPKAGVADSIPVWFAAGDAGDGSAGDVAIFEAPRIVAPGRPDLLLADLRGLVAGLAERRTMFVDATAEILSLVAGIEGAVADGAFDEAQLDALADRQGVDRVILRSWLAYLGIGQGGVKLDGRIAGRMESHPDYPLVKGWTAADALSVIANPSDETVKVPGTMKPHSLAVHPSPTLRAILAWKSPVAATVAIDGAVQHAHAACGNGVTWVVEVRRGGAVVRLASGKAQGDSVVAVGPFPEVTVKPGDVVLLSIGPGGRDHSCDLTAVDLTIRESAGEGRTWNLAHDVVPDLLAGNPHADALGHPDVWHFVSEPDADETALAVIPRGSLLDRWRSAGDTVVRRELADGVEKLLRDGPGDLPADAPDRLLHGHLTSLTGPLLSAARAEAPAAAAAPAAVTAAVVAISPDPALFGVRPEAGAIDRTALAFAAPNVVRVDLPAELVAGAELVTTATVAEVAGAGGSIQAQVLLEAPAALVAAPGAAASPRGGMWSDGAGPPASSNPILVREPGRREALEAQFARFRETFPAALCYTKIVPVDEVVTLTLYHREDDQLKRLVLSEEESARLDALWHELHFVSGDALQLVDAYEQLWQYATQDADPSAFEGLRQPILDRAAEYRAELAATEPVHLDAVVGIARQAWRRPLAESEGVGIRSLYTKLRGEEISHDDAIRALLARVFVAPAFLYHLETAPPGEASRPVSDHELAARLASFLWSSLPDAELSALADAHELHEPAVLARQVTRMLADPKVDRLAQGFGCQWLHVADFDTLDEKSASHFPEFAGLRQAMHGEAVRFFADFFRENRPVSHLLDADHTFADSVLAAFYGAGAAPAEGAPPGDWQRLDGMKARGRGGILGLSAVLAKQSGASRTSPILRGAWLSETVLGRKLPKPPKGIPILPEVPPEGLTERKLTELHSTQVACAGCHRTIDPYGFALEGFDAIGRARTKDSAGLGVDSSALLPGRAADDATIAVEGLAGLRDHLVAHHRDEFVRQFAKKLLGYALGRSVQLSDEPLLEQLEGLADQGVGAMVKAIVASSQFREIRGRDMLAAGVSP